MNEYTIKTIAKGVEHSFEVKVTKQMMEQFFQISNDNNPLHICKEYALQNGFSDVVVYGCLLNSFVSRLAGVYLPGKYCLLQEISTQFVKPVYVNDLLRVTGTVTEVDNTFNRIIVKYNIVKISAGGGKKVARGSYFAGIIGE